MRGRNADDGIGIGERETERKRKRARGLYKSIYLTGGGNKSISARCVYYTLVCAIARVSCELREREGMSLKGENNIVLYLLVFDTYVANTDAWRARARSLYMLYDTKQVFWVL